MKKDISQIQNLAINGFVDDHQMSPKELLASGTVELIRPYIQRTFQKIQTENNAHTSYGLKHFIEGQVGRYVANGELIYAMYLEGFKIYRKHFDINCRFNISEKSFKGIKTS